MGHIEIKIVTADPERFISQLIARGYQISNVIFLDGLTVRFSISILYKKRVQAYLEQSHTAYNIITEKGIAASIKQVYKRPVLVVGIAILLFLTLYFPSRILFVTVKGNTTIPDKLILEHASDLGLGFSDARKEVRSESIKNQLISRIPQLQWVGINTYGCVAEITVRERQTEQIDQSHTGVSSVVAVRDGIIQSVTVTQGSGMCQPGQAVKQGQTLISGYSDLGLVLKGTQAQGEIYALTQRQIQVVSLAAGNNRGDQIKTQIRYSLEIGKKRINFYKGSGILPATCVKMYEENYLSAPGGFSFPVKLIRETILYYEDAPEIAAQSPNMSWLYQASRDTLISQMTAGKIINSQESVDIGDDLCYYYGKYTCLEMIGQMKKEEFKGIHG